MIDWNENYELKIEKVDKQHKYLIQLLNEFKEVFETVSDKNVIETLFLNLINYCNYHFENEEMVMQECNYPDFDKHRTEHDIFFNNLERAKLEYLNGNDSALSYLIEYIEIWIIDHIIMEDKKYIPELAGKF
ncbi:MAG: bacteriohemerythrin [Spirochaetia bacterium]|nr:bacteriohemerythrin [Spirochaetia bacterium]